MTSNGPIIIDINQLPVWTPEQIMEFAQSTGYLYITNNQAMTDKLKTLRVDLDGLSQLILGLPYEGYVKHASENALTPPTVKALNSVLMAKAWAGKLLGELGEESPYKNNGTRVSITDIEPTDCKGKPGVWIPGTSYVQRVDRIRQLIAMHADEVKSIELHKLQIPASREAAICRTEVWKNLVEARIHLGFELQRLRENHHNKRKYPVVPADAYIPEPGLSGYDWKAYKRTGLSYMRPYVKGEDLSKVSVSKEDDPETDMGMIARNSQNHQDQWYVARQYFNDNLELA